MKWFTETDQEHRLEAVVMTLMIGGPMLLCAVWMVCRTACNIYGVPTP